MSIVTRSFLASAGERTGVAPFVTTCFGPRTAAAGFTGRTWLTTSQFAEHADRGQLLLHGRDRPGVGPDVGRHVLNSNLSWEKATEILDTLIETGGSYSG